MRKVVMVAAVVAVVAIAVAVSLRYGVSRLDGVVAATVERYGSAATGTDVSVGGVDLALSAGRADLADLTIDNPDGYDTDFAVRIGRASVVLDIGSLTGDVPIIEELVLRETVINAEQRERATNLTDIQQNATAAPNDASPPDAQPGKIVVKRFRLSDARVLVTSEYLSKPEELPLRDVVVDNIGGTGGATYSQAAEAMLTPVLAAARSAATERLRSAAAEAAGEAAREELEEESDELRERADEAKEKLSERVDELLDRG